MLNPNLVTYLSKLWFNANTFIMEKWWFRKFPIIVIKTTDIYGVTKIITDLSADDNAVICQVILVMIMIFGHGEREIRKRYTMTKP